MKIINPPDVTFPAGATSHFLSLRKYFSDDVVYNQYKTKECIGHPRLPRILLDVFRVTLKVIDVLKFSFLILKHKRPSVLLNPSFGKSSLLRDAFLRLAKLFGCKVGVVIHGNNGNNRTGTD